MSERPTPETDAQPKSIEIGAGATGVCKYVTVSAEFARKLERERDEIATLVRRLFDLLETVEVSDSEREFHPTYISSCRVMHTQELNELLPKLKEAAK